MSQELQFRVVYETGCQIVEEMHNGKLSCNSVLDNGTEFVIEIPLA
jgi:hypothetical protein